MNSLILFFLEVSHYLCSTNLDKTCLSSLLLCDLFSRCSLSFTIVVLLNTILLLRQNELNVRWLTGILSNPTVSPVSSTPSRWGTVTLSVANIQIISIQSLRLSVGNSVGQQILYNSGGLYWPATNITWGLRLLGLGFAADSTSVLDEWYDGLEGEYVVHEFKGFLYIHSLDVVGDFAAVLEVHAKVGSSGF